MPDVLQREGAGGNRGDLLGNETEDTGWMCGDPVDRRAYCGLFILWVWCKSFWVFYFFCLGVARILFILFLLEMGLYSLVQTEIPFGWITDGLMKDLISFGHMCMYQ